MSILFNSLLKKNLHRTLTCHQNFSLIKPVTFTQFNHIDDLNKKKIKLTPINKNLFNFYSSNPSSDHSKLWVLEKIFSAGLLAIIPASFIFPSTPMDYLLSLALVAHIHWGIEAIVVDYIRPNLFGNTIPKVSVALVYLLSFFSLAGIFYFNYIDVGLIKALKMFFTK